MGERSLKEKFLKKRIQVIVSSKGLLDQVSGKHSKSNVSKTEVNLVNYSKGNAWKNSEKEDDYLGAFDDSHR